MAKASPKFEYYGHLEGNLLDYFKPSKKINPKIFLNLIFLYQSSYFSIKTICKPIFSFNQQRIKSKIIHTQLKKHNFL